MNIKSVVMSKLVCSEADSCNPETDEASEIFANVCETIFRRGLVNNVGLLGSCGDRCIEQATPSNCARSIDATAHDSDARYFHGRNERPLHAELKKVGHLGHPIIIEFLIIPKSVIEGHGSFPLRKHIPGYLTEQWMIQFLPKRLVTDALSDIPHLLNDINSHCKSSLINKVLFGDESYKCASQLKDLCCVCRLTNLLGSNVFSPCWFSLSANELLDKKAKADSAEFGFILIRDFTESLTTSDGIHTTTRAKRPKRMYLCRNFPSHVHQKDTPGICVSRSLCRILAGSKDVLDTMVSAVRHLPPPPPMDVLFDSLRYLQDGAMSLPTKRCDVTQLHLDCTTPEPTGDVSKTKASKSPILIMSQWTKPTSFFESPPCKLKRMHQETGPRVDDCISRFTSLSVQKQHVEADKSSPNNLCIPNRDPTPCRFPLVRKSPTSVEFSPRSSYFNQRSGLPLRSSPVPFNRKTSSSHDSNGSSISLSPNKAHGHDVNATSSINTRPTSLALKRRPSRHERTVSASTSTATFSSPSGCSLWGGSGAFIPGTPLPSPSHQLIINFEESMLNGRIPPAGMVEGFTLDIGASGSFFPAHVKLPVMAYFFRLSEDESTPSPYLGYVDLTSLSNKRGYHVPRKGSIQLTLFNPCSSVMKVFVIQYDLEDMPPNCQTFLRQRTVYMPVNEEEGDTEDDAPKLPSDLVSCVLKGEGESLQQQQCNITSTSGSLPVFLRYLVHLRFHTTKSKNLYLHTDIRLIFARDTFEFDPRVATYRMRSFIDGPSNPRFSPKTS